MQYSNIYLHTNFTHMRIKDIIKEKGITQQILADRMGVSLSAVRQMVGAQSLTTSTVERIATALDVPMWQIFASPGEVAKEITGGDRCPHCGGALRIRIDKDE